MAGRDRDLVPASSRVPPPVALHAYARSTSACRTTSSGRRVEYTSELVQVRAHVGGCGRCGNHVLVAALLPGSYAVFMVWQEGRTSGPSRCNDAPVPAMPADPPARPARRRRAAAPCPFGSSACGRGAPTQPTRPQQPASTISAASAMPAMRSRRHRSLTASFGTAFARTSSTTSSVCAAVARDGQEIERVRRARAACARLAQARALGRVAGLRQLGVERGDVALRVDSALKMRRACATVWQLEQSGSAMSAHRGLLHAVTPWQVVQSGLRGAVARWCGPSPIAGRLGVAAAADGGRVGAAGRLARPPGAVRHVLGRRSGDAAVAGDAPQTGCDVHVLRAHLHRLREVVGQVGVAVAASFGRGCCGSASRGQSENDHQKNTSHAHLGAGSHRI